jgi:signal transduction histidine kinase
MWFPASAAAVITALISRGRRVIVAVWIALCLTAAGIGFGRPVEVALAYGIAIGCEAWIVAQLSTRGKRHAPLHTVDHLGWFWISCTVGVLAVVVVAGTGASIVSGENPLLIGAALLTSHLSAIVALVPTVLVPLSEPVSRPRWELYLQWFTLLVLAVVVFGPAASLAITFLLLTTLMWAAARFPSIHVVIQIVILAFVATVATSLQIGPFASLLQGDFRSAVFALQLFILTSAAGGLFVSAQSSEWRAAAAEVADRERDALAVAHRLAVLNAQQEDFISAVSHELRTPVTSILGFSELLVDGVGEGEPSQAERIIYRNARRLADVIDDVLELSVLSTSQYTRRPPTRVNVAELLQNCVDDVIGHDVHGSQVVRVSIELPSRDIKIDVVEHDLTRALSNLLTNAVKFSPPGATVTITVDEDDEFVSVAVSDVGPGIPLEDQGAVWERFYRVQSPAHSDAPGTGLGLPIVRSLVHDHMGGTVTLVSDGHSGTTMVVNIPRTPPDRAPTPQGAGA